MKEVFAVFLCVCAWKDLKEKEIPVIWLKLFAAAGIFRFAAEIWRTGGQKGDMLFWTVFHLPAFLPGIFLLAVSYFSRGAVGKGDGLFFLTAGLYLNFRNCLTLLLCGLLFCSAWGLGIFIWGIFAEKKVRDIRLPFLPFLIPAALILQIFAPSGLMG